RVLQRLVPLRQAARDVVRVAGIGPAAVVVGAGVGVVAGEQPAEVLRVGVLLGDQRRGVGVRLDVLPEEQLGLEHVPDHAAEVHGTRGSTGRARPPRICASITPGKATGWASARCDPSWAMRSELARSCTDCVAPPRPNEAPRPGTVAECQMLAWFSIWMAPAAVKNFLIR